MIATLKKEFIGQSVALASCISNTTFVNGKQLTMQEALDYISDVINKNEGLQEIFKGKFSIIEKHSNGYKRKTDKGYSYGSLTGNDIELFSDNKGFYVVEKYENGRNIIVFVKNV